MTETERQIANTDQTTFNGWFITKKWLGCFDSYAFVVIKNTILYVYPLQEMYSKVKKGFPLAFMNLSTVDISKGIIQSKGCLKIKNSYVAIKLMQDPSAITSLKNAIEQTIYSIMQKKIEQERRIEQANFRQFHSNIEILIPESMIEQMNN